MRRALALLNLAAAAWGMQIVSNKLNITTRSLPDAIVGVPYSATVVVRDPSGPVSWSIVEGSLPPGLSLGPSGMIAGIPTQKGEFSFAVRAQDSEDSDTQGLRITVTQQAPVISTGSLPDGMVGVAYAASLAATGGVPPYTWAASGLPSGLGLSGATIAGTPAQAGQFSVRVQVTDAFGASSSKTLSLNIAPPPVPLSITTTSLPNGTVGVPYGASFSATGGTAPYVWSVTPVPPGLSVNGSTLAGTPSAAGTFSFEVRVTDAALGTVAKTLGLTIAPAPVPLSITTTSLPNGTVGVAYSASFSATGGTTPYAWSVTPVPPGLSVNGSTLAGTPSAAGTFSFEVRVTDAVLGTVAKTLGITIAPAPVPLSITTTSLPNGRVSTAYSAALAASGGTPPYTWNASGLPAGIVIDPASGAISGTPTAAGDFSVRVDVTDSAQATQSKTFPLSIAAAIPPLSITTASLPGGSVGVAYTASVAASGGTPPYAFSATGLASGLSMDGAGAIGGTPQTAGNFQVAVQVRDSAGQTTNRTLALAIASAPQIFTTSLPPGTVGVNYSAGFGANGGVPPLVWSMDPAVPGLALNSSNGQISGSPTTAGSFTLTVRVRDANNAADQRQVTLTIAAQPQPIQIATTALPGAILSRPYAQDLAATGGTPPYRWLVTEGSLPPGLGLDPSGHLSGTPTVEGSWDFTVQLADSANVTETRALRIAVGTALSFRTQPALPGAAIGTDYSQKLEVAGGTPPLTWSAAGALPPGITLDSQSGALSGKPTTAGNFTFSIEVRDGSGQTASRTFSMTVASGLTIASPSPLPAAAANTAYSYSFAALAGVPPYTWSVSAGALPAGLTLNASTGVLSGTPTASGTQNFTIQVTDNSKASVTKQFTLTVTGALTVTTDASLPAATAGVDYSQALAAIAGTSPYTWTLTSGSLPPGLTLSSAGLISGRPTTPGDFNFTVQVLDSAGVSASKALSISVAQALRITSADQMPAAVVGQPYSQRFAVAGGSPPYRWTVAAGALPPGLALDETTGNLSGTPSAAGDSAFTIRVTDGSGGAVSTQFSIRVTVSALPALQMAGLPDTANSLDQPALTLTLERPYPVALSGQLTLSFEPDAAMAGDDPSIQFSTGGRTAAFTVDANTREVRFAADRLAIQTGSVAGAITLRASLSAGGADATPTPPPQWSVRVLRAVPSIRSVKLVRTSAGFEVWITGLANSRELSLATFQFTPAAGSNLQTTEVRLPLADAARQWYQDANSRLFGSQFTIVQPFTVAGNPNAVGGVSVTLANPQGSSQPASAAF